MPTNHVEYLLPDYVNGKLEESLRRGVENHIAECPRCESQFADLRETLKLVSGAHRQPPAASYFSSVLPRIRVRLEEKTTMPVVGRLVWTRLALPIAVGALAVALLLHVRVDTKDGATAHNPLGPVVRGVNTTELVEIAVDQMRRQLIQGPVGEAETNALFAATALHEGEYLSDADVPLAMENPFFEYSVAEELEQLSDADLEALVAGLSERTDL